MNQVEKAARFSELHVKGAPLLLYNAWDAGTAKSILDAGAKAIATSSWAVGEAQGYRDGESIPITFVEQIIARIVSTIDAPVSVDFEGGYSDDNGALAENAARLLERGIIGINFEDRVVQGAGLYPIDQHARRIAAIREAARAEGEGEIGELHIGLKGTMNALFLKDLADKTRRGLSGRIKQGRSAGGISYGYRAMRELDARGEPVRGGRVIADSEAEGVRRMFREFAGGRSPRDIAVMLN